MIDLNPLGQNLSTVTRNPLEYNTMNRESFIDWCIAVAFGVALGATIFFNL